MRGDTGKRLAAWSLSACAALLLAYAASAAPEYNAARGRPIAIGPEARRLIVEFRATPGHEVTQRISIRRHAQRISFTQALTTAADVAGLAGRARLDMATSRQLTASMHVVYLRRTLYGAEVAAALATLRADATVEFADVDQRRYPHAIPDDPLFNPSADATGQWYMMKPSSATPTSDASATDAVSAWSITTGSTGTVIADVDTGVRFDHPDLLRAGFGGRMLPGYDFVSEDENPTTGVSLGTFLIANDGDGRDPDPSDPGDWINSADQANTTLFPSTDCPIADSSWHGTRVMGILGALTDNGVGISGMTWNPYLLPVRALGKCGGYDSDIISGMQWAAGISVVGVPDNPYPADIINLSLGGTGACPSDYADIIAQLGDMGILVVASAGNAAGPVDAPANCSGVLAVAGLRNVGTKVGYSSLGAEVGVAAPAGNCVNSSGACLRSIDTTSNTGLTVPSDATYTTETDPNLGTSFSAPIVTGVAALMRAVNANLTPAQLIARIESSAVAFPQPVGLPVCPAVASDGSGECACPNDGSQCGAGMVNALAAVTSALNPIAAVSVTSTAGGATLDASGSAASCGRTIAGYAWVVGAGVSLQSGSTSSPTITVMSTATGGTVTLTVIDSAGARDATALTVAADGSVTKPPTTPAAAGSAATACPVASSVKPSAPTITASFSPASVGENANSTLSIVLANTNGFDLTQSNLNVALPANLTMATGTGAAAAVVATTCGGGSAELVTTAASVSLSNANIPAQGSCVITVPVRSTMAGGYRVSIAANALVTGPAGANTDAATGSLTVTAPSGGGGAVDWWDTLFVVGVILAGRRRGRNRV